jgi:hypothetical protein
MNLMMRLLGRIIDFNVQVVSEKYDWVNKTQVRELL